MCAWCLGRDAGPGPQVGGAHGDFRPEAVLLSRHFQAKVAKYGVSVAVATAAAASPAGEAVGGQPSTAVPAPAAAALRRVLAAKAAEGEAVAAGLGLSVASFYVAPEVSTFARPKSPSVAHALLGCRMTLLLLVLVLVLVPHDPAAGSAGAAAAAGGGAAAAAGWPYGASIRPTFSLSLSEQGAYF